MGEKTHLEEGEEGGGAPVHPRQRQQAGRGERTQGRVALE